MKSLLLSAICCFGSLILFAQDIKLSDSVIFIDNKQVAFYQQELINSANRYNVEVYNSNDDVLIKADVVQFNTPVSELKPFYYYELIFPPTADTVSIYVEEKEAFSMTLAKIIRDYGLINNGELNKHNVSRFKEENYGTQALSLKIKYIEDHLNQSRYFYEQVVRDRSKPVLILDNKDIIQDGKKIGNLSAWEEDESNLLFGNRYYINSNSARIYWRDYYDYYNYNSSYDYSQYIYSTRKSYGKYICLLNGRRIEYVEIQNNWTAETRKKVLKIRKQESERNLYKISKAANKNISTFTDQFLLRICALIEEFAL